MPKKEKKKKVKVLKGSFYKVEDGKLIRTRKVCKRCGQGVFMAEHKDRYTCGSCHYTEWKK
jgi:small subunit ribosomal protein S27Ae